MWPNSKSKCQKQLTLTTTHLKLGGSGLKNTMKKILKVSEKMWIKLIRPGLKKARPNISAAVVAKTKELQLAQRTSN